MSGVDRLEIQVTDDLTLDGGRIERLETALRNEVIVHCPTRTLFAQLLDYLQSKPPAPRTRGTGVGREGCAAAALCLRWGSYFAVLADGRRPLWRDLDGIVRGGPIDQEMARINIESSAALTEWIGIYEANEGTGKYRELVDKAVHYLPGPAPSGIHRSTDAMPLCALASHEFRRRLFSELGPARVEEARARISDKPHRVIANYIVSFAWRNGPIENIHADAVAATAKNYERVVREAASRFAVGMDMCLQLCCLNDAHEPWVDLAIPFITNFFYPSGWTLDEECRSVQFVREPKA